MQRSNDFQLYHPAGKKINVSCSDTMFSSVRQSYWTWSPNPVGENSCRLGDLSLLRNPAASQKGRRHSMGASLDQQTRNAHLIDTLH